ncbi:hypothetical protein AB0K00_06325 [Dactylosporangium sp. NPDC049525]|uniref:hypothetical protein n=1 Tax=Dactylosporangium sp. NPDC049525 TaxID=3154730 RepID=UPI0034333858
MGFERGAQQRPPGAEAAEQRVVVAAAVLRGRVAFRAGALVGETRGTFLSR